MCSSHFIDGKPTTANPHPTIHLKRSSSPPSQPTKRNRNEPSCAASDTPTTDQEPQSTFTINKATYLAIVSLVSILLSLWRKAYTQRDDLRKENERLEKENYKLRTEILFHTTKFQSNYMKCDSDVRFFTGLKNAEVFQSILNIVQPYANRRWKGSKAKAKAKGRKYVIPPRRFGPKRKLTSENEMLLTLMKLRLGLAYKDLAKRFQVSISLCTQVFNCWLTALYRTFGKTVKWYPKEHIRATMPFRFRSLPHLRSIIDCSEIFIETPKDFNRQAETWSHYKHHNTMKFLISVAPNSAITYVSPAYGGRVSDKEIVMLCQFLDLFDPHDMIMADKGFSIQEDCAFRSIHLMIPPGKRGITQMSVCDVEKTQKIAKLRILVEQVIRRLKTFRILKNQLPICQLHCVDKIITVCAALSNTNLPIFRT